jgi:acyl carrier protein
MDILEKVTAVVAEVLELEEADVAPDANLIEDLGMDSVLAIDVATALEKHYRIKVPDEQMEALTTPRAIATIVGSLVAANAAKQG